MHEADPRSPERGQYGFVQSIIREVAYGMLSKADRRARHLSAAHHFEAADDDELAGVVAAHYVEALARDAGGTRRRRARRAGARLARAGGRARDLARLAGSGARVRPAGPRDHARRASSARTSSGRRRAPRWTRSGPRNRSPTWSRRSTSCASTGDVDARGGDDGCARRRARRSRAVEDDRAIVAAMRERLGEGGGVRARAELDHATAIVALLRRGARGVPDVDRIGR